VPGNTSLDSPGVSFALARDRAARVSHISSALHLSIPEDHQQRVHGYVSIRFLLTDASSPLLFDFQQPSESLIDVVVNQHASQLRPIHGHISIPTDQLVTGDNTVVFQFVAGSAPLNRRLELVYSLFVPARASEVFPCFDQPDLKVRWRLSLQVPVGWNAVSNTTEVAHVTTSLGERFEFAETAPLPTYLLAFAAGRLRIDSVDASPLPIRVFHMEEDTRRLTANLQAVVDQHARALRWLEEYTDIPYPFGKLDMVLIPAFQFGGMEHPGAIFYKAGALLLDGSATQSDHLTRANLIAHETAHMWFGDLVTMTWFDDVWMKEVFASLMATKIVEPVYPQMNHELRFLLQHHPLAYDIDRTAGTHAIRQPLDNLAEAGSLYGPIIYQKAPIAMRQLELLMGEDALRDGLREYLKTYAFRHAAWPELLAILDRRTAHDVPAWSRTWIEEPGMPVLRMEVLPSTGGDHEVVLHQADPLLRCLAWPQRTLVSYGRGTAVGTLDVDIVGSRTRIEQLSGRHVPEWMVPVGGTGYGRPELTPDTVRILTDESFSDVPDPIARAAVILGLREVMLDGRLSPAVHLQVLMRLLESERDSLILQVLLDQTRTTFWRFIPPGDRPHAADQLEPLVRRGLALAARPSERASWFAAFRSMAVTASGVAWLNDLWSRRIRIDGLPLSNDDEAAIAVDLCLRVPERAESILAEQTRRTSDADRRARLEFIAPALAPTQVVRAAFFEGLHDVTQRSREEWVLDAMRCLHHPIRALESAALVRPALDMVSVIHDTGDIFFPKRWVEATLSGHQSRAVAFEVQQFLDTRPRDFPPRLTALVRASGDLLFRAAAILEPAG
jgi:aminopeptidase N